MPELAVRRRWAAILMAILAEAARRWLRRRTAVAGAMVALLAIGAISGQEPATEPAEPPRPVACVDPFVGSGGFGYAAGSAFPGAAAPHGLAKVGPDTSGKLGTLRFLHFSGYWHGDDTILGFSHLHLHGTGAPDYGVLAVMPSADTKTAPGPAVRNGSKFRKQTEAATPGYYAVTLERGDIRAEIAATEHGAHHRTTFASGAQAGRLYVDLDHHLEGGEIRDAELELDPAERMIRGRFRSLGGLSKGFGGYDVHFAARTRQAWTTHAVWSAEAPPSGAARAAGRQVGCALTLDLSEGKPLEFAVAVSFVDGEGAACNLAAELPDWDFDGVRRRTEERWNDLLGAVRIAGGSDAERTTFYSALYRGFLMPTIASDVDGRYRGADGQVHVAEGFRYLTDFSLWDTYRTLHPLYPWIAPASARDSVRSLHAMAREGGFFPQWPIATRDSGCMIGASAEIVVADAYVKGVDDFDAAGAYAILRAAALDPAAPPGGRGGRDRVEEYDALGYVPSTREGSVSLTLEYAQDDFALAQLAAALGKANDARRLLARSRGWRKLYDPETGFLRGRDSGGALGPGKLDPLEWGRDYVEANAWHSLWGAGAHDLDGLAELLGGREALIAKLSTFFEKAEADAAATPRRDTLRRGLPRPYYWHGNEPDIHAAYLFAQAGRPDLTQRWVRWIERTWYRAAPDGLAGNDDGGTLSAWYVFSALGLYPIPGSDRYVIGAPLFPRARIAVRGGEFTVAAPAVTARNLYVQSVRLNGKPLAVPELRHADLSAGGSLEFEMGPEPGEWGRR